MGMNKATEGMWLPQGKYGNEQGYRRDVAPSGKIWE